MLKINLFSLLFISFISFIFCQTGNYTIGNYTSNEILEGTQTENEENENSDVLQFYDWTSEILVTEGKCSSDVGDVTWNIGKNMCNGTSYQSCMPSWDGTVKFKDRTPSSGEPVSIGFTLYGSFGCGTVNGYVNFTLNGINTQNSRFIYSNQFNCGCGILDEDSLSPINLNTTTWIENYNIGTWNTFEISSDPNVNLCLCGLEVSGRYYGTEEPLSSKDSGTGWLYAVATLTSLAIAFIIVVTVGILVFYKRKQKQIKEEADEFDVEFGDE